LREDPPVITGLLESALS
jgi:hypothetical protein